LDSIAIKSLGKKFRKEWIFRNININLERGEHLAVYGHNGSGKSTFIQIISGFILPTEGEVNYFSKGKKIHSDDFYKYISFSSPYLDLIDELTLEENINFYIKHKPLLPGYDAGQLIELSHLSTHRNKEYRNFSSGMKQRIKLILAVMADTGLVLFDEPLSNLDQEGYIWFKELVDRFKNERIFIVCSNNVKEETTFCDQQLHITDYQKVV
jgi:ABC-type multidrug transport system ATPase subunit